MFVHHNRAADGSLEDDQSLGQRAHRRHPTDGRDTRGPMSQLAERLRVSLDRISKCRHLTICRDRAELGQRRKVRTPQGQSLG